MTRCQKKVVKYKKHSRCKRQTTNGTTYCKQHYKQHNIHIQDSQVDQFIDLNLVDIYTQGRCEKVLIDKNTRQERLCRNPKLDNNYYCLVHKDCMVDNYKNYCCFCNDEIRIDSQSCGRCARQLSRF